MKLNRSNIAIGTLATLITAAASCMPARAQEHTERTLSTVFEVQVRTQNIVDGTSNTSMVAGILTIRVDSTGAFAGEITPGKDDRGVLLPSVIFRGPNLDPDLTAPQTINVTGQMNGRLVALSFLCPSDDPNAGLSKYIFGTGVTTDDLSKVSSGPITGAMAGSATVADVTQDALATQAGNEVIADWAAHPHTIQVLMADGSVRSIHM